MTCAKKRVFCTIKTISGKRFYGENLCDNPQAICPREPGEDYAKCESICQQRGHAEIQAIRAAGDENLTGAHAILSGIHRCCTDCSNALRDAGFKKLIINIS